MKRLICIAALPVCSAMLLAGCGSFPRTAPVQERSPVLGREGLPPTLSRSAGAAGNSNTVGSAARNPDKPVLPRPPSGSAIAGLAPPQPAPGADEPVAVATPLRGEGAAAAAKAPAASTPNKPTLALATPAAPSTSGLPPLDWVWPVDTPMTQTYSEASKGVDFTGVLGQPVRAAAAGEVAYVTNSLRGYGLMVVVRHDKGYLSVYAHNRHVLVKEGQHVERGQRIAEMGSSDSKDVILHFELRHQGRPLDPVQVFPGR